MLLLLALNMHCCANSALTPSPLRLWPIVEFGTSQGGFAGFHFHCLLYPLPVHICSKH